MPALKPCPHPRESWYADREYGTTFCGICHENITHLVQVPADVPSVGMVSIPGDGSLFCRWCGAKYDILTAKSPSPEAMKAFVAEHKVCQKPPMN